MKKLFLGSIAMLTSLFSWANDLSDSTSTYQLPEVEVKGVRILVPNSISKIPVEASKVPLTVNLITAKEINTMNYLDVTQALRDVPGVNSFKDYGAFDMFFIRGFHESLVLYDGVRDERHTIWQSAPITGLGSIERIEVLKGASSMSVGHSALGGVINIVRKKPTHQLALEGGVTAGSYGTILSHAGVSSALTSKLLMRADIEGGRSDGWRANYNRIVNGQIALNYLISDNQSLSFSILANKDRYKGDYGQPHYKWDIYNASTSQKVLDKGSFHPNVSPKTYYSDPKDELKNSNVTANLKYHIKLPNAWHATNHLAFSTDKVDYYSTDGLNYLTDTLSRFNHYYKENNQKIYISIDSIQRDGFAFKYDTKSIQNQLDITKKILWKNTSHNLLIGYNFAYMNMPRFDRATYTGKGAGSVITTVNPILNQGEINVLYTRNQEFTDRVHALYAQDFLNWKKWSLLVGLRFDLFSRKYVINDTNDKQIIQQVYNKTTRNKALTYRLGVVYQATDNINIYASTSNMYKPQRTALSSDVIYVNSNGNEMSADELTKISPLTGTQYEIGTKMEFNNQLSWNIAAFHMELNNVLKSNLGQTSTGKSIGGLVGRSASTGIETEIAYSPTHQIDLKANYSFINARVKKYSSFQNNSVKSGNKLERVPNNQFSAWAFYRIATPKFSSIQIGFGAEHNGKAYTEETNAFVIPSYTIYHATISLKWHKYTLQVNANNLLDKTYYRNVINSVQYIPAAGRHLLTSIRFNL